MPNMRELRACRGEEKKRALFSSHFSIQVLSDACHTHVTTFCNSLYYQVEHVLRGG